jgi:hypothetical protein
MSFYGGSFYTRCRQASCASDISGSWPIGAARSYCHCASRCWRQLLQHHRPSVRQTEFRRHSGPAHSAEVRWQWSRDSRLPSDCALLPLSNKNYDLLFDISNRFSAGTPAPKLSVPSAQSARRSFSALTTPLLAHFRRNPIPACKHRYRHSKRITSRVQTAHFKSLYRKRSGPRDSSCSRS